MNMPLFLALIYFGDMFVNHNINLIYRTFLFLIIGLLLVDAFSQQWLALKVLLYFILSFN